MLCLCLVRHNTIMPYLYNHLQTMYIERLCEHVFVCMLVLVRVFLTPLTTQIHSYGYCLLILNLKPWIKTLNLNNFHKTFSLSQWNIMFHMGNTLYNLIIDPWKGKIKRLSRKCNRKAEFSLKDSWKYLFLKEDFNTKPKWF